MTRKKVIKAIVIAQLLIWNYTTVAQVANQVAKKTSSGIGYLEYLPQDYNTSNKNYPLMIFLHGIDEVGNGTTDLYKVAVAGPPKEIKNGHNMTFTSKGAKYSFIVISPQLTPPCPTCVNWYDSYVNKVLQHALQNYRVDTCRIYLTGLSLGGNGVWNFAYSKYNTAGAITAMGSMAGWGNPSKGCVLAEKGLPVWAFHGEKDGTIVLNREKDIIEAINNCSNPIADPKAVFTIYPGMGHNCWDKAYKPDHTYHNPNIYEWMLVNEKKSCNIITPIKKMENSDGINFYYLKDKGFLSSNYPNSRFSYCVSDLYGRKLFQDKYLSEGEVVIDFASLNVSTGMLLLKVEDENAEIKTFKIIR